MILSTAGERHTIMTEYAIPYGNGSVNFVFSPNEFPDIITPRTTPPASDPISVVRSALDEPLGSIAVPKFTSNSVVSIAINDKTRPVPHHYLLTPLLELLHNRGASKNNIRLFIASGTHTPMQQSEISILLHKDILANYSVSVHDCDDKKNLEYLGETKNRTPVWINREYSNADYKIVTGNIEPHHFMGFSGGVKSASIGLTGRKTINTNHTFLLNEKSALGLYHENPMRQDVEEIGQIIGVDFALNTILDEEKRIISAISGEPGAVMRRGIQLAEEVCAVPITKLYDLVIASVGGFPKDINLYQSQKALSRASLFTRNGGVVILVAECAEGSGSSGYEAFMENIHSSQAVFTKFKSIGFEVGPHKALQFARELQRIQVILFSDINPDLVKKLLLIPASTTEEALSKARHLLPPNPAIALLPFAKNILPKIQTITYNQEIN